MQINYLIAQDYEYTIEHFDGVGDDSTDNRNAFDSCLSQGYPVILQPNKTYRVSGLNNKSYSHITIRGGANSVISGEFYSNVALFRSLKNVAVSNVTFRNYTTVFRGNNTTDFADNLNFINTKFISNQFGLWFDQVNMQAI